jgi:hypothetical protein
MSFVCGRVEVDGDVMAAWLVRLAFRAPTEAGRLHGHQLLSPRDVEIRAPYMRWWPRSSRVSGPAH